MGAIRSPFPICPDVSRTAGPSTPPSRRRATPSRHGRRPNGKTRAIRRLRRPGAGNSSSAFQESLLDLVAASFRPRAFEGFRLARPRELEFELAQPAGLQLVERRHRVVQLGVDLLLEGVPTPDDPFAGLRHRFRQPALEGIEVRRWLPAARDGAAFTARLRFSAARGPSQGGDGGRSPPAGCPARPGRAGRDACERRGLDRPARSRPPHAPPPSAGAGRRSPRPTSTASPRSSPPRRRRSTSRPARPARAAPC